MSHSTINQCRSDHPYGIMILVVCYLHNLTLKNRQASTSDLAQELLLMEIRNSVTIQLLTLYSLCLLPFSIHSEDL